MSAFLEGFILHSYARSKKGRTALYLIGRIEDGSTFAIVENRYQPNFYIRKSDCPAVEQTVNSLATADQTFEGGMVGLLPVRSWPVWSLEPGHRQPGFGRS